MFRSNFFRRILTSPVLAFFLAFGCGQPGSDADWTTFYEQSNFLETPSYEETVNYLKRLDQASPHVKLSWYGETSLGRDMPVLIVDYDGRFKPVGSGKKKKAVVLIQAGIHAGEIDGKDAGLMLIRDIAIHHSFPGLLENTTLLFIPIYNIDGHERSGPFNRINQNGPKEMGWRVTAQNLNLNRDYLKADAPETRSWLQLFRKWMPDLFIDCHVTNGADYQYVVTYSIDDSENLVRPVRDWVTDSYVPSLVPAMEKAGFPLSEYVWPKDRKDITRGIRDWVHPPRFSTGYSVLWNRPGMLIETHMFKPYKQRVTGTYHVLLETLKIIAANGPALVQAVAAGDARTLALTGDLPLDFALSDSSRRNLEFAGYRFHIEDSPTAGTPIVVWDPDTITYSIPFLDRFTVSDSAQIPDAYLIPAQWSGLIDVLHAHGIRTETLSAEKKLPVTTYRFENVTWAKKPYEGRFPAEFVTTVVKTDRLFPAGSFVVRTAQPGRRVLIHLLEPLAPDSFVRWGFMNTIFERKEYYEDYVMAPLAEQMLEKSDTLKSAFRNKLESDPEFAGNPQERLDWFYKRSPYWDSDVNLYPVGKLFDTGLLGEQK